HDCVRKIGLHRSMNGNPDTFAFKSVKLPRVLKEGRIAVAPDVFEDRRDGTLRIVEPLHFARDQRLRFFVVKNPDHYITILFNGYSTIPWAPASLRRGIRDRTVVSSRIVLTASHPSSLRCEIVGFFSAGKTPNTDSRLFFSTLSISPTLPRALIAP